MWQLDAFTGQCLYEVYQQLISYHDSHPPLNHNIAHAFYTAQSSWDFFRNMHFQWNMELSNLLRSEDGSGSSEFAEFNRTMGLAQAQLMKARAEQLIVTQSLLLSL